jgi:hypothetical protein
MAQTVQRRGQGMDLTREQVAIERARTRVGAELLQATGRIFPVEVIWSPEESMALRAMLEGKGVRVA